MNKDLSTPDMLTAIIDHYSETMNVRRIGRVGIYRRVSEKLSGALNNWTWRYILSVNNGTVEPSKYFSEAVVLHYQYIIGLPQNISAPACPDCGGIEAHTYRCGSQAIYETETHTIKKKAAPRRKRPPRIAVRKDDPASAYRSLKNNLYPGVLSEIVRLACEDGLEISF